MTQEKDVLIKGISTVKITISYQRFGLSTTEDYT
jgi:hypothetical protein